MKKLFSIAAITLACTTLLFTSCKKDKSEEPTPSTEQNLTMHLHSNVGTHTANYDPTFINSVLLVLTFVFNISIKFKIKY